MSKWASAFVTRKLSRNASFLYSSASFIFVIGLSVEGERAFDVAVELEPFAGMLSGEVDLEFGGAGFHVDIPEDQRLDLGVPNRVLA